MLTELSLALDHAEQSADVRAIVFTCLGDVFCNGVDLPSLLADDKDKRRLLAAEMAIALKLVYLTSVNILFFIYFI